jgi:Tfp pilus assembly protein PilN
MTLTTTDTVTRTRVEWAPVPKVNLLPPEVLEARRFARTQRVLAGVVGLTVVVAAASVGWAQSGVGSARAALEATEARTAGLQAEQTRYADVPRLLSQVSAAELAREKALADDSLWYRFLGDLAVATPADVSLSTMSITVGAQPGEAGAAGAAAATGAATAGPSPAVGSLPAPGAAGAAGAPGAPAAAQPLGRLTFSGKAQAFPDVAAWLDAVARLRGLDGSSLQTASRDSADGVVSWTSSISLTSDALSHRYDRKVG